MANYLLEQIINDTVQSYGGPHMLEKLSPTKQIANETIAVSASSSKQPAFNTSQDASALEDGLSSLMQDVEMDQRERIFWILLFSLMILVAAGGNIIVIYIVSTNKEMKSVTNYFLVNLSLADTMVSTLNVIFNFISMLNSHWPFGNIYCKISNFIAILSISASVFTLTAISCDRYNAIIYPLRPRMSHRHAIGWILLIWTLSAALAMPNMIYSLVVEDRLVNENLALTCTMIWPDGRYPLSSYDHIYNIIILVVTYLVPILTMAILYYKVGKELWGYEAIGENVDKQRRAIMAKKKIVKMMIVVVSMFALCWLPYHGFFVVNFYLPTIFQDGPLFYQRCYLIMYWLAMSNSMYNPIIIYFMNSKFRHEFRRVLWLVCCCRVYSVPQKSDNQTGAVVANNNNNNNNHPSARTATCQSPRSIQAPQLVQQQQQPQSPFPPHHNAQLAGADDQIEVMVAWPMATTAAAASTAIAASAARSRWTKRIPDVRERGGAQLSVAAPETSNQQQEREPFLNGTDGSRRRAREETPSAIVRQQLGLRVPVKVVDLSGRNCAPLEQTALANAAAIAEPKVWI